VLVVDDEELYRSALDRILTRVGHTVVCARDANEALEIASVESLDLVLCDLKLPGLSGLELVRQLRELHPDLPCILITGHGGAEQSIEALRAGAFWYLEKPFEQASLDVIRRLVDQAIELGRLRAENRALQRELRSRYRFESIVGQGAALRRVLELVERVADSDSTALVTGESGTGKELIARALHWNSRRADRAFVTVNCGAIPEQLLESELFGHIKGAFTHAVNHREGRFALANHGTIFLDEIGDMSPTLQVKLLRVLQDRTFEPVGSSRSQTVDVRVIAATNQDLELAIQQGRFRQDLFYRLNVIPIHVPPLRERREDVPLLVGHFLKAAAEKQGRSGASISREALDRLCLHDWPGNVRELENLVERLVVLHDGEIGVDALPAEVCEPRQAPSQAPRLPRSGLSFRSAVDRFESDLILQALRQTDWNKNRAARLLGLGRTTLIEKIKRKGLEETGGAVTEA
jgi:DNA-binding NtrC family response regulator